MNTALGCGFLLLGAVAALLEGKETPPGGEPVPAPVVLQIRARELWTAAGERIPDGLLVIADGKVRSAGAAREHDPAQPLVRHDGVVTAGLIACRVQSGAGRELQDDTRSVLPGARAAYAFDPAARDFERLLAAGITTVGIAPGPANLVGGLACVLKTADGRVLDAEASLALSLSSAMLGRSTAQGGFLFGAAEEEALLAQPDGGPEATWRAQRGTREPTSYAGALSLLERLLARGEGPFARVKKGELPVQIEAWDRHEVLRATDFARKHGLKGAVRGAPLAGDATLVAALKESGLGAIVGPYSSEQTRRSLESVKNLAAAGVPVAFALESPARSAEELRLCAARAQLGGASKETLWKALTEDAALLSGVADSVGRLAPGLAADFVLWSGDPLDLSSRVEAVYSDGKRVFSAPPAH